MGLVVTPRGRLLLGVGLVLSLWTWQTHRQAAVWTSNVTLWRHAVRVSPMAPRAHLQFALGLSQAGDWDGALAENETAYLRALDPGRPHDERLFVAEVARVREVDALFHLGRIDWARDLADSLTSTYPDDPDLQLLKDRLP